MISAFEVLLRNLKGNLGRIREIGESPDGFIYFSTSNRDGRGNAADDDKIMRNCFCKIIIALEKREMLKFI